FCPGAVTAGKLTNMKNTVDPWATRMGVESALLAQRGYSGPEHIIDGKEGLYAVFGHVDYKGTKARFETGLLVDNLPKSPGDHYPKLVPVMDKVKVVANTEFESLFPKFQPSQVTITTADGKSFTKRVDVPKGDPRDPMTAEEVGVKFLALGRDVLGDAACRKL